MFSEYIINFFKNLCVVYNYDDNNNEDFIIIQDDYIPQSTSTTSQ